MKLQKTDSASEIPKAREESKLVLWFTMIERLNGIWDNRLYSGNGQEEDIG